MQVRDVAATEKRGSEACKTSEESQAGLCGSKVCTSNTPRTNKGEAKRTGADQRTKPEILREITLPAKQ